jgi:SAM-dependent methyltransferase
VGWAPPPGTESGDWLEVGIGPLGVGCTHLLQRSRELHTLDPIEPTAADEWQLLPEPCKALVRSCQDISISHVGKAEQLDFPDDAFVLVAAENMLDHVQDPGAVPREARRVLKPGGRLLVTVDTFFALGKARYRLIGRRKLRDTTLVRAHPRRFSSENVVQLVAAAASASCRLTLLAALWPLWAINTG